MNNLIVKYSELFKRINGSSTGKIKAIIKKYASSWESPALISLTKSLLADTTAAAFDLLDVLKSLYKYEGGNMEFKAAIIAIEVRLRKAKMLYLNYPRKKAERELFSSNDIDIDDLASI